MTNVTTFRQDLTLAFGIANVKTYLALKRSDNLNPMYVGIWLAFAKCWPESPGLNKETPTQMFSCEYWKIFNNICFEEHLCTTSSENNDKKKISWKRHWSQWSLHDYMCGQRPKIGGNWSLTSPYLQYWDIPRSYNFVAEVRFITIRRRK